jgi:hypothetical protein
VAVVVLLQGEWLGTGDFEVGCPEGSVESVKLVRPKVVAALRRD